MFPAIPGQRTFDCLGISAAEGNLISASALAHCGMLVSWCVAPSQSRRITSGLKRNFNPSPTYLFRTKVMKPKNSSKPTKLASTQISNKTYKHQTQIFEETVDQISLLLKKHLRLGHADIVDFCLIYRYPLKKKCIKNKHKQ